MENKQLIHIASEVVILLGLTFYFNQKNKKMMGHIEDLAQRVEEQEDLIQKHEQIIRKLIQQINNLPQPSNTPTPQPQPPRRQRSQRRKHNSPPLTPPPQEPVQVRVSFNETPQPPVHRASSYEVEEIFSTDEDSDLDAELANELGELDDEIEEVVDLKKE